MSCRPTMCWGSRGARAAGRWSAPAHRNCRRMGPMVETAARPATLRAAPDAEPDGKDGGGKNAAGRAMDVAGVCPAAVLGGILFGIVSGGAVTRWRLGKQSRCGG